MTLDRLSTRADIVSEGEIDMSEIQYETVVPRLRAIIARGLSNGLGTKGGQVCIEAAACEALGLPHGDDPQCVSEAVRSFKIRLNDSPRWESAKSRADGLLALGVAQLGSKGVVSDRDFARLLAERVIRVMIPTLFREVFPNNERCLAAADRCEREGAVEASREARAAAYAAYAADAEKYLRLVAGLALGVLIDLKSPGAEWLTDEERSRAVRPNVQ